MSDEPDDYQTYILRMWRVQRQGEWHWHASIESRRTAERQWFANLDQLFAFLNELPANPPSGTPGTLKGK